MRFTFYIFLFLSGSTLFGQNIVNGYVTDSETDEPLLFTYIIVQNTTIGTITNEEGYFELNCSISDSLEISHLGYSTKQVLASDISKKASIKLVPINIVLNDLVIVADDNYLYEIVERAKNKFKSNKERLKSKAYLNVISSSEDCPVEYSESYYNADIEFGGVKKMIFKNGKSYLSKRKKGGYYLSLDISKALSGYSLIKGRNSYPKGPFELSKRKLRKRIILSSAGRYKDLIEIEFVPKNEIDKYFSGRMWIDIKTYELKEIEFEYVDHKNKIFEGMGMTRIDMLNFKLKFSFSSVSDQTFLNYVQLNYQADLIDGYGEDFSVSSESILHIYDYNKPFVKAFTTFPEHISDYRLFTIPPDTIIWTELTQQNQIKLTKSKKKLRNYIIKEGQTFSNDLHPRKTFFEHNYHHWTADGRQILKKTPQHVNAEVTHNLSRLYQSYNYRTDQLNISAILYLDILKTQDSFVYETSAIFDIYDSFNHLDESNALNAYVNIYFDLAELYRKKMELMLSQPNLLFDDVNKIYIDINEEWSEQKAKLEKEAFAGRNLEKLEEWNSFISQNLGIDNMKLFDLKE